jgi:hypothetical protein
VLQGLMLLLLSLAPLLLASQVLQLLVPGQQELQMYIVFPNNLPINLNGSPDSPAS